MSDITLINIITVIWLENGGDSEGFNMCSSRIKEKIKELELEEENE